MTIEVAKGWVRHFQFRYILANMPDPIHHIYLDLLIKYTCETLCTTLEDKICDLVRYLNKVLPKECITATIATGEEELIDCKFYELKIEIFYFLVVVEKDETSLEYKDGKFILNIKELAKSAVPESFWSTSVAYRITVKKDLNSQWETLKPLQNITLV
jgi:hypothetical protein